MQKILITDYKQRHSQIIIKDLSRNYEIYSFTKNRLEAFFFSVNPLTIDEYNIANIITSMKKNGIDTIVPISIKDYRFFSEHKYILLSNNIKILISDIDTWSMLNDKNQTMNFADRIGVPIPKTIYLNEDNYIVEIKNNLHYKVVIKSVNEGGARFVKYANNADEVNNVIKDFLYQKSDIFRSGVIAQEYIEGKSCAYFCIAKEGKIISEFGHIRVRENPPTGGVSTSCQSFYNEKLFSYGRKIVTMSKYSGVCMVEFKYVSSKDEFYLIEVNPKFWGSILLPIVAGIDFPNIYMDIVNNKNVEKKEFKDIKIQHVLSDLSRSLKYKIDFIEMLHYLFSNKVYKDLFYMGIFRFIKYYIGKRIYD